MAETNIPDPDGYVALVIHPTGDITNAVAWGPHDERAAHHIATTAVRLGGAAYLINLTDLTIERYQ